MEDGEHVALDWIRARERPGAAAASRKTIVVILHGIAGGSHECNVQVPLSMVPQGSTPLSRPLRVGVRTSRRAERHGCSGVQPARLRARRPFAGTLRWPRPRVSRLVTAAAPHSDRGPTSTATRRTSRHCPARGRGPRRKRDGPRARCRRCWRTCTHSTRRRHCSAWAFRPAATCWSSTSAKRARVRRALPTRVTIPRA